MIVKLLYTPMYLRFQPQPPLGIATLAAVLRRHGFTVQMDDLELKCYLDSTSGISASRNLNPGLVTDFERADMYVRKRRPDRDLETASEHLWKLVSIDECDILGFSVMSFRQFCTALLLAYRAKAMPRRPTVIFGGEFIKSNAVDILHSYDFIDYVATGHAYECLPVLAENLRLEDVSGMPSLQFVAEKRAIVSS